MGELLKGLIEYIGDDYTEEQNPGGCGRRSVRNFVPIWIYQR